MTRFLRLPLFWLWCLHPPVGIRVFYRCVHTALQLGHPSRLSFRMIAQGYRMCSAIERAYLDWRFPGVSAVVAIAEASP